MATLEQEGYLWRDDDGDEDEASPLAAQDANITRWRNINTRLRTVINATGDPDAAQFRLEYRKKGTSTWYVVNTGAESALSSPSASLSPSISPSLSPSVSPSVSPSASPSLSPSASLSPSISPSVSPSLSPSVSPSASPSLSPSKSPSISPSVSPSLSPSASLSPSKSPSISPSLSPSLSPSFSPSKSPSVSPSISPSASPSVSPSASPSGGGGGSERLDPSGDGAVCNWTCSTGTTHWNLLDEGYDTPDDITTFVNTNSGSEDRIVMANTVSMGAEDTCTRLDIDIRCVDEGGAPAEGATVKYSIDEGTNWIGTSTATTTTSMPTWAWVRVSYAELTLTKTEVDHLVISYQRISGNNTMYISTLSVLVTYE